MGINLLCIPYRVDLISEEVNQEFNKQCLLDIPVQEPKFNT